MNARMTPATADSAHPVARAGRLHPGERRPGSWDYLAYLLILPLIIAAWMTVLGIRPRADIGAWQSFSYVATRVLIAWWAAHAGALAAARLMRGQAVPLWGVMLSGFLIIWLPVTYLFSFHLQVLSSLFPELSGRFHPLRFSWSVEYLMHFLGRSAIAFLPLWVAVAHAYRKQFGVDWYPTARRLAAAVDASRSTATRPTFLAQSRLPAEARILTLKAAEHYIEVVADRGTDLVRHRFNDAVQELAALGLGCQVHRSWWVSWDAIAEIVPCGRSLDLLLHDGRRIPVSLTYKHGLLSRYPRRALRAGDAPPTQRT